MAARIRFGQLVGAGLLALLAGCPFSDDDDDAVPDPQTTQVVGAAGGQVASPDGSLKLDIPAGALAADTAITVVKVAPENQSDLVRAQNPLRVYRFEPDGLVFAQPVTATIDLPPGAEEGQVAFALMYSGGRFEPASGLTLAFGAAGRRMTAQIAHFSQLLVVESPGTTAFAFVEPRAIKVGETLDATLAVAKEASGAMVTIEAQIDYIATSNPVDLVFVTEKSTDFYAAVPPVTLPASGTGLAVSRQTWKCVREHTGVMRFNIGLTFPYPVVDVNGNVIEVSTNTVSRLEPAEIDYVCDAAPPPPDALRTGVFTVPFGMTAPDGVHLIDGAFANLGGTGPFLSIAGNNGLVIMDLRTGLSALNMTPGGPDGRLGNGALLGALPVSQPSPGPATVAGQFASGAAGAVRSYTPDGKGGFIWGFTQVSLNPVLDASAAGGGVVTGEVITTEPRTGLNAFTVQSGFWQYDAARSVRASLFPGTLVSAALPFANGEQVLALTDDGTQSRVWDLFRFQPGATPTPVADLGGAAGRRLRCLAAGLTPAPLASFGALCGATSSPGELIVFITLPTFTAPKPTVTVLPVGKGALGLAFGLRSSGDPVGVVANLDDQTLNVIDFDTSGVVTNNRTLAVPSGCVNPPHAVPVAAGGKDYIAGSCNGSGQYYVIDMPAR